MASTIKVDTISEKTSANGVAIDGLTIKDGGLVGDVTFADGAYDFDIASHDTSNGLKLGGTLVTATAAELNIMDGVTSTATEINLIDGGTSRGTTAVASGDGILINDAGTMRMTNVDTVSTYFASHSVGGTNIATVGTIGTGTWQGTAIASTYIAADAITGAKIADDAIDSEHYTDGSIDNAHIADDAIDSEHYAAGSIDTAHIADDQITLAKMASGTDGNIISYDASGNPVAIATGSDGEVLTSTGAGSPPAFEAASGGADTRDAVGTYAMCRIWNTSSTANGTTAGSYLEFASYVGSGWSYSGTPSGTWRCMGIGGAEGRFELWIRTA